MESKQSAVDMTTTDMEVVSSYVEDGNELNVLVSTMVKPNEKPGDPGRTLDEVKAMSRAVTEVTHNHPDGIRGAEATSVATFLARTGKSMGEIRKVVVSNYYRLNFSLDEIRDSYKFDVSCQGSVPQALEAFFESTSFEDAIRNAISIGGDSDTIGAICGAVAGAYYGVPKDIHAKSLVFLPADFVETLVVFEHYIIG